MSKFLKSLVRSEAKSCTGKIKFPREDSAQRSADEMMRKKPGEVFEYYECVWCRGWHIGHRTNFDWIPPSHTSYTLMICRYVCFSCLCNSVFFTNTVVSNRIIDKFPAIKTAPEVDVVCPKCRKTGWWSHERCFVPLKDVDPESTETIESLWERMRSCTESCS